MTHMPGIPIPFDKPDAWKSCSPDSTGQPRYCLKCKSTNVKYRIHESSCGGWEDEEIKCFDCNYVRWVDGIDS
jgi:hypothetical protein